MPLVRQLSASLEDYLETIYELVRDQKVARVRDIARARGVRAASVTPAMRRLVELGLIHYQKREYIDLTPQGRREAQRVCSRHEILKRFFEQVLRMPEGSAVADACAMEHSLSPQGMDYLVRFFEFLDNCEEGRRLLDVFHDSWFYRHAPSNGRMDHERSSGRGTASEERFPSLASLPAGSRARVVQIAGVGEVRGRLLDMGLLPDVLVEVVEVGQGPPGGEHVELRVQGFSLRLTEDEARAVKVTAPEESS